MTALTLHPHEVRAYLAGRLGVIGQRVQVARIERSET